MDTLRKDILTYLGAAKGLATAAVIARTVATVADINAVYAELGHLVRAGAVKRQHHPDGLLRYGMRTDDQPTPLFAAPSSRKPVQRQRAAPLGEIVLAAMSDDSMSVAEIHAACAGQLTAKQVSNLLQLLKRRGQVTKTYGYRDARWIRVDQLGALDQPKHQSVVLTITDDDLDTGVITINLTFDPPMQPSDMQTPATAAALAAFEHLQSRSTVLSERAG